MKSYPDAPDVQTNACGALRNMICDDKENTDYIVNSLHGANWIIAAMNKFPEDAELQQYACGALDNIMTWDEFHDPVKQAGGLRALVDAIENHKDESNEHVKELQQSAKGALKKLLL